MTTAGVHVEIDGVMKNLDEMAHLIEGKTKDVLRYARSIMKGETEKAFMRRADPATGRAWPQRKHSYPWPLLDRTGTLKDIVDWSYGVKTKDGKTKLYGKVEDGFTSGSYTRGGGGISMGARKPWIVVVGSVHFGRKNARSAAMWKPKEHGYLRSRGRMVFHGGGTRLEGTAPSTGGVPARGLFGFGRSARKRIKRYAEKRLAKVFD